MKTLILLLLSTSAFSQVSLQMKGGFDMKTTDLVASTTINFALHGFALTPELIIKNKDTAPALFGLRVSYEHAIANNLSLEAGSGRYFNLYSTDYYDKYKNHWSNLGFAALHWKKFFVEYNTDLIGSIGFREKIGK